jgi:D-arabinan exo alpha-(1,3)/(1,5)-arabinofuranosidase (non-reducing end)
MHRYQGSLVADRATRRWVFYRLHVPDPIFFRASCSVALQQIGGARKTDVLRLREAGAPLTPVTIDAGDHGRVTHLLGPAAGSLDQAPDTACVNFYRRDDVSATAYYYLDQPGSDLPALQPQAERTAGLPERPRAAAGGVQ